MKKIIINLLLFICAIWAIIMLCTPVKGGPVETTSYIVQPGDTLWEICEEKFPNEDPRKVIYEIKKINGMKTSALKVHQKIQIPKEI